jgi:hypothetical protein
MIDDEKVTAKDTTTTTKNIRIGGPTLRRKQERRS